MSSVDVEQIAGRLTSLYDSSRELMVAALELLEGRGPQPGLPLIDMVSSLRHCGTKELRP